MIIDKKGKLFGKINIIDLLVILVIIFFAFNAFSTTNEIENQEITESENALMTLEFEEVHSNFLNVVEIGDLVRDSVRGFVLGEIVEVHSESYKEMVTTTDGKVEYKEIPGKYNIQVILEIQGVFDGNGVLVESKRYYIGSETRIKTEDYVTDAFVLNITKNEGELNE
ncbi:MAG: DUF4330 domain-containing protein [Eubacteriales bacterium]